MTSPVPSAGRPPPCGATGHRDARGEGRQYGANAAAAANVDGVIKILGGFFLARFTNGEFVGGAVYEYY